MRSTIIAAAFAAGVLAVPYQKRDIVTDVDVVYATDIVTVTEGAEPTSTPAPTHSSHSHGHWWKWTSSWEWTSTEAATSAPAPTSTPAYTPPATTEAPTTAPTSTYTPPPPPPSSTKPSSTEQPATTAPATSAAASSKPTTYQQLVIAHHNLHRANHSAPDIAWDDGLASSAQTIAESCVYAHNVNVDGGGYGQNIAAGVEANNVSAIITNLFYNGEEEWYAGLYGQASPDMTNFEHWGHFSQIVWHDTTHVACYTQDCTSQGLANVGSDVAPYFTVCNYKSPGNYAGEYTNVGSPLGEPTANWDSCQ